MSNFHRVKQLVKYGWLHAGQISKKEFKGKRRLSIFLDIFSCYQKYNMWSNQYLNDRFWELDAHQREEKGNSYKVANNAREDWVKDFYKNRKFIAKWSRYDIEASARKRELRNAAYTERYGFGTGCIVEHGVELSRQHHLPGELKVGNYVRFCKDTFIDYSGGVVIADYVTLCFGTSIETHDHDLKEWGKGKEISIPSKLTICEGAFIGLHTTILNSCNYIGKYARIGAGAVVTHDIPDYAMAVGIPAKIVKYVNENSDNDITESD